MRCEDRCRATSGLTRRRSGRGDSRRSDPSGRRCGGLGSERDVFRRSDRHVLKDAVDSMEDDDDRRSTRDRSMATVRCAAVHVQDARTLTAAGGIPRIPGDGRDRGASRGATDRQSCGPDARFWPRRTGQHDRHAAAVDVVVERGAVVRVDPRGVVVEERELVVGGEDFESTVNPTANPTPRARRTSATMPARTTELRRTVMTLGSALATSYGSPYMGGGASAPRRTRGRNRCAGAVQGSCTGSKPY